MSDDKLYTIKESTLTDIADSIRAKTGSTSQITPVNMPEAIASIDSGWGDFQYSGMPFMFETDIEATAHGSNTNPYTCVISDTANLLTPPLNLYTDSYDSFRAINFKSAGTGNEDTHIYYDSSSSVRNIHFKIDTACMIDTTSAPASDYVMTMPYYGEDIDVIAIPVAYLYPVTNKSMTLSINSSASIQNVCWLYSPSLNIFMDINDGQRSVTVSPSSTSKGLLYLCFPLDYYVTEDNFNLKLSYGEHNSTEMSSSEYTSVANLGAISQNQTKTITAQIPLAENAVLTFSDSLSVKLKPYFVVV